MGEKITEAQKRLMHDIAEWCPSPGYATSWKPKACAKLAAMGLIEQRSSHYWDNKVGWYLTDAAYAAMSATP